MRLDVVAYTCNISTQKVRLALLQFIVQLCLKKQRKVSSY
jgi:hypothetical protein